MSRPLPSIAALTLLTVACARVPYVPSGPTSDAASDAGPRGPGLIPERCTPAPPLPARSGIPCTTMSDCAAGEWCPEGGGFCTLEAQMPLDHEVASVSDDGRVALVLHREENIETVQRWTLAGGLEDLPIPTVRAARIIVNELDFAPGHAAYPAILSGDGRVVYSVANLETAPELLRWDGATERRWPIATDPVTRCHLAEVSTDGSALIGVCVAEGLFGAAVFHGFRLRDDVLDPLARGDEQCVPVAMSSGAEVVLGHCQQSGGPVQWDDSGVAQVLTRPEGAERLNAHAISVDGTIIVGGAHIDPGPGPTRWLPVRWVCGVPHVLPLSPRMTEGIATDTSADGAFVVGLARRETDETSWGDIWDEMFGWREGVGTEHLSRASSPRLVYRAFTDPRGELAFTGSGGNWWAAESYGSEPFVSFFPYVVARSRRAFGYAAWEEVPVESGEYPQIRRDWVQGQ